MNELHVVVIVSQVPEFVCKQLRKTVMQLCTSLSMPESSARIVPRYLKYGTTESCSSPKVKAGSVGGTLVLHWQITSVLVVLTVSPTQQDTILVLQKC